MNTDKFEKIINEAFDVKEKINTCLDAVKKGVRGVVIIDGRKSHSILDEIFSDSGVGTLIR